MRTAVFDLDGTLVDSVRDIAAALNRLMASHRLAEFSVAEVSAMVGNGAKSLVERGFLARGRDADSTALAVFLRDYEANALQESRLYPGVCEGLRSLTDRKSVV